MDWKPLLERSHVPYSNQPNASYVKGSSGRWYPGVRIENISFPLTISALQAAIFNCLSRGDSPTTYLLYDATGNVDFWEKEFGIAPSEDVHSDGKPSTDEDFYIAKGSTLQNLKHLLAKAVVPHSQFPVSALLQTASGFIGGVNIEVSEWAYGLCAERVALAKAISHGATEFLSLHIHTAGGNFSSPCGACRQVIIEHLPQQKVYLHHPDGTQSIHRADHLLPFNFNAELHKNS